MAPTEGRFTMPERQWDCHRGTPTTPNYEILTINCYGSWIVLAFFFLFKQHWYPGRSVGRTGSGSWTDNATSQSCQATSEEGAIINFASRFRDAEAVSDLRTSDGGLLGRSTQLTKCYLIV